jgi:excisionase family DNA binding protein
METQTVIPSLRDLLDEVQAAAALDVTPGTLAVWRSTGRYKLPFIKVGRKVRYRRADLEAWLEARTFANGATA